MAIEYLGLSAINGPMVVLEGVQDAAFDEIVEMTVEGRDKKIGSFWPRISVIRPSMAEIPVRI